MTFCYKCGAALRTVYRNRKFVTLGEGDTEHWKVCAGRRLNGQGKARTPKQSTLHDGKPLHVKGRKVEGDGYLEQCKDCPGLPWESCPCHPPEAA